MAVRCREANTKPFRRNLSWKSKLLGSNARAATDLPSRLFSTASRTLRFLSCARRPARSVGCPWPAPINHKCARGYEAYHVFAFCSALSSRLTASPPPPPPPQAPPSNEPLRPRSPSNPLRFRTYGSPATASFITFLQYCLRIHFHRSNNRLLAAGRYERHHQGTMRCV